MKIFLVGIIMKIGPLIGTPDYRADQIRVRPDLLISDWRLQLVLMVLQPL
jgi:hypothetical protein